MRVYLIETNPHPWELGGGYLLKATKDRNAARMFCVNYVRDNTSGTPEQIEAAVKAWEEEFETFVPAGANAEGDLITCFVIEVEDH